MKEVDAFSHGDYADAAADALLAADKTFTLGLFGDWGLGKTTIVQRVGEIVRERGFGFVEFDVWRFEGDALRRQFLREAAHQLKRDGHLPWFYRPARKLRDLEMDIPIVTDKFRFSPWAAVRSILIGLGIGFLVWLYLRSSLPGKMFGSEAKASTANEVSVLVAFATFIYGLLSQIILVEQRSTTVRRIEEPERFYSKFVELLKRAKPSRVVIAIDNLDRCSPRLVDKMLATIKTYLEPAQDELRPEDDASRATRLIRWLERKPPEETDAVFLIAADEAGVRRHMVAREIQNLPPRKNPKEGAADGEVAADLVEQAERNVDEYLRKFFDASIKLRPILREDIRKYTRLELDRLIQFARASLLSEENADDVYPTEVEDRLISLVASALRRNPRRIKQFANSLETRIRMIQAREASGGIPADEGVSSDLLGVAKLAIIEEEWPDFYDELQQNPRRLALAQKEVERGDINRNPRLSAFLRASRDVTPANVAAVVNLKLESDELRLEGFAEFREAIVFGDFDIAREIVTRAEGERQAEYPRRLAGVFERELELGALAEARNVLEAALGDPPLRMEEKGAIRKMLSDAAADPALLNQLPLLDTHRVFSAMHLLPQEERERVRSPFLDLAQLGERGGAEAVEAVTTELAKVVDELTAAEKFALQRPINIEPSASQFRASFLPLMSADRTFVSAPAMQSAWQSLTNRFDPETPEFEIMVLGFSSGQSSDLAAPFVQQLTGFFTDAVSNPVRHPVAFEAVIKAVKNLSAPEDDSLRDLLVAIHTNFPAIAGPDPFLAASFSLRVGDTVRTFDGAEQSVEAANALLTVAAQNAPLAVAQEVSDPAIALRADTRAYVADLLEPHLPNHADNEERLVLLNAILAGENGKARVGAYLRSLVHEAQIDSVEPLLSPLADKLEEELDSIFDALYELARTTLQLASRALRPIINLVERGNLAAATYLIDRWEQLRSYQRYYVRLALVNCMDADPDKGEQLARIMREVNFRASDREPIVRALIRASKTASGAEERAQAFRVAQELASSSKPLRALVGKQLAFLRKSEDPVDAETVGLLSR